MKTIMEWRSRLGYSELPKIQKWGLEVSKDMQQVEARVLPPPKGQF